MPDGQQDPQSSTPPAAGETTPPAGAPNTGTTPPTQPPQQSQDQQPGQQPPQEPEQTVPYARFKEVNDQLKELKDWKDKLERERQEAEDKEAEKRGEFEKLLGGEKDAHAATKAGLRKMQVELALRDYLLGDEKRQPYAAKAKYISPFVEVAQGADSAAITTAVKAAADQWITDNPIASALSGAPANRPTRGATQEITDEERRKRSYKTRM